jgi:hypothetical protein
VPKYNSQPSFPGSPSSFQFPPNNALRGFGTDITPDGPVQPNAAANIQTAQPQTATPQGIMANMQQKRGTFQIPPAPNPVMPPKKGLSASLGILVGGTEPEIHEEPEEQKQARLRFFKRAVAPPDPNLASMPLPPGGGATPMGAPPMPQPQTQGPPPGAPPAPPASPGMPPGAPPGPPMPPQDPLMGPTPGGVIPQPPLPANPRVNPPRPMDSQDAFREGNMLQLFEQRNAAKNQDPVGNMNSSLMGMGGKTASFHKDTFVAKQAATSMHRGLSDQEKEDVSADSGRWLGDFVTGAGTPLPRTLSSPGKGAVLHGAGGALLGGAAGAGLAALLGGGSQEAMIGAGAGAGLGGSLGAQHGYLSRRRWNEDATDLMRRLPKGATLRDYLSDSGQGYNDDRLANLRAMRYIVKDLSRDPFTTKESSEKTALLGFNVGNALRNVTGQMAKGAWKPSAVAVRKGLTDPATRLSSFGARANQWLGVGRSNVPRPNFNGMPRTTAPQRALRTYQNAAAQGPQMPEGWFKSSLHNAQPFNPAEATPETGSMLGAAFGLKNPVRMSAAPGMRSTASAGSVTTAPAVSTALHETGHIKDFANRGNASTFAPSARDQYAKELMANRNAGKAIPAVNQYAGQSLISPRTFHGTQQAAAETYRLDALQQALGQNLRGEAPGGIGAVRGPWPRQLDFKNPYLKSGSVESNIGGRFLAPLVLGGGETLADSAAQAINNPDHPKRSAARALIAGLGTTAGMLGGAYLGGKVSPNQYAPLAGTALGGIGGGVLGAGLARHLVPAEEKEASHEGENCPSCGTPMERDPYSGKCNHCGADWPIEKQGEGFSGGLFDDPRNFRPPTKPYNPATDSPMKDPRMMLGMAPPIGAGMAAPGATVGALGQAAGRFAAGVGRSAGSAFWKAAPGIMAAGAKATDLGSELAHAYRTGAFDSVGNTISNMLPAPKPNAGKPMTMGAKRPSPMRMPQSSASPAKASGLKPLMKMSQHKTAAQDSSQPPTSATGESKGLTYRHKPDHYMQGQDAWASVGQYFKHGDKHTPNPFEGKHAADLTPFAEGFFGKCAVLELDSDQVHSAIEKIAAEVGEDAADELRAGLEKMAIGPKINWGEIATKGVGLAKNMWANPGTKAQLLRSGGGALAGGFAGAQANTPTTVRDPWVGLGFDPASAAAGAVAFHPGVKRWAGRGYGQVPINMVRQGIGGTWAGAGVDAAAKNMFGVEGTNFAAMGGVAGGLHGAGGGIANVAARRNGPANMRNAQYLADTALPTSKVHGFAQKARGYFGQARHSLEPFGIGAMEGEFAPMTSLARRSWNYLSGNKPVRWLGQVSNAWAGAPAKTTAQRAGRYLGTAGAIAGGVGGGLAFAGNRLANYADNYMVDRYEKMQPLVQQGLTNAYENMRPRMQQDMADTADQYMQSRGLMNPQGQFDPVHAMTQSLGQSAGSLAQGIGDKIHGFFNPAQQPGQQPGMMQQFRENMGTLAAGRPSSNWGMWGNMPSQQQAAEPQLGQAPTNYPVRPNELEIQRALQGQQHG